MTKNEFMNKADYFWDTIKIMVLLPLVCVLNPKTIWRMYRAGEVETTLPFTETTCKYLTEFLIREEIELFEPVDIRFECLNVSKPYPPLIRNDLDCIDIWFKDKAEAVAFKIKYSDNDIEDAIYHGQ